MRMASILALPSAPRGLGRCLVGAQGQHELAFGDQIAWGDEEFDDATAVGRRNVQSDLAGFEDDQDVVAFDALAREHQDIVHADGAAATVAAGFPTFGVFGQTDFDDRGQGLLEREKRRSVVGRAGDYPRVQDARIVMAEGAYRLLRKHCKATTDDGFRSA